MAIYKFRAESERNISQFAKGLLDEKENFRDVAINNNPRSYFNDVGVKVIVHDGLACEATIDTDLSIEQVKGLMRRIVADEVMIETLTIKDGNL